MFVQFWHDNNKKPNNKNNTQTQASKPHSYKTTCALGMFRSGFKHGILSSSHFQIIRWVGCKSHVATLNGHMTLGVGWPCFFGEGDRLAKPCRLSSKFVTREKKKKLNYLQKHTRFPFLFLLLKWLLGNSAQKLYNAVQMIRSYEWTHQLPHFGNARTSFSNHCYRGRLTEVMYLSTKS